MLEKKIEEKIKKELPNALIKVTNFSSEHYGHDAGGAHIEVTIKDQIFKDLNTLKSHKLIYKILDEELKDKSIHALKINTGSK